MTQFFPVLPGRSTPALALLLAAAPLIACAASPENEKLPVATSNSDSAPADTSAATDTLEPVTVLSNRETAPLITDGPGTFTVIDAKKLAQVGATDMGKIIRYEPLISAPQTANGTGNVWDGSGYTGYNIRGVEGNRVGLDLDGIPLPPAAPRPDSTSLNAFAVGRNFVDPAMFATVEIASGTTVSGRGNSGLGGRVAFRTLDPEDLLRKTEKDYRVQYTPSYASADSMIGHAAAGAVGDDTVQALLAYSRRDGSEIDSKGSTPQNPLEWNSNAALAKLVWTPGKINSFSLGADYYLYSSDANIRNRTSATYPEPLTQDSLAERLTVSLGHTLKPQEDFVLFDRLDSKLYYQTTLSSDETFSPRYVTRGVAYRRNLKTDFENDNWGFNTDATKQAGKNNLLGYGLTTSYGFSRRPWEEVRTRISDGQVSGGTKDRMAEMHTVNLAAYIRDDITLNPGDNRIIISPGLRAEYWNFSPGDLSRYVLGVPSVKNEIKTDEEAYVNPSLGLTFGVTKDIDLYAKYNRGARVPTPVEKTGTYDSFSYTGAGNGYAVLGNPDLKRETGDAFEAGVTGKNLGGVTFKAGAFYTHYKDFIEYAAQPTDPDYPTIGLGLFRPENIGTAEIYGAESSVTLDFGAWEKTVSGVSATFAAGMADSTAKNTKTGVSGRLPSVGPFKGTVGFAYDHPAGDFGVALLTTYIDSLRASTDVISGTSGTRYKVPSSTLLDITAYWRINEYAVINLGLYNITDRKNWTYASARGLAEPTSGPTRSEVERLANPGFNGVVSVTLSY